MGKLRPTLASLNEKAGQGYVFLGIGRDGVREYVEHECRPPRDGRRYWQCGCGREWKAGWL